MPNKILARSVKKKGASAPKKQISKTKQGVDTAAKMRSKIQNLKNDEEIHSASEDEEQEKQFKGAITEDIAVVDPFFDNENADEKRLRMTKKLIKTLGEEQKNEDKEDFFSGL
jgi:peptide methionine sulfoxide reductase MsrA